MTPETASPTEHDPDQGTDHYVIIIGAMKSGTTSLFALLAAHPQIAPAQPKEPGFFAFQEVFDRGVDWYHGLFDFDPARHRYRLEASTDYTKTPFVTGVPARMMAHPQARYKLIYILRHPLRRIESHAQHVQLTQKEIGQIVTTRTDHGFDNGVSLASLAMTRYASQLDPYRAAFEADDLLVTTLEELTETPAEVLARIYRFLDLPQPPAPAAPPRRNAAQNKVRMHGAWAFLTEMPGLMALGKRLLPGGLRERIKQLFRRSGAPEGRFRLTPEEEAALQAQLAPDLARLQSDYGVDAAGLWDLPVGADTRSPAAGRGGKRV